VRLPREWNGFVGFVSSCVGEVEFVFDTKKPTPSIIN
jgi:hypothetical protein